MTLLAFAKKQRGDTERMIKFVCDSCGKDITEKVFDSVRQFYGKGYFERDVPEQTTEAYYEHSADNGPEVQSESNGIQLEVKLLDEFLKVIHAHAWNKSRAIIQCGSCAVKRASAQKAKVKSFFTRMPPTPSESPYTASVAH
jgi:hypothetical protein